MALFTYDTPRPRPQNFPISPDIVGDVPEIPEPLPEEKPGEWGDPVTVDMPEDPRTPDDDDIDEPTIEDPEDPLEPPIKEPDPVEPPVEEPPPGWGA